MPRGSTTQTRTFNYTSGSTVGAVLLGATNPENGTVSYTYNSNMTLHTKTDAKTQVFTYTYDSYNRLTQISVGSTVLRTYVYDSNTDNPSYSQNGAGRLVEVKYGAITYLNSACTGSSPTTTFTDMYSYTQAGQVAGKDLHMSLTQLPKSTGGCDPVAVAADLNLAYAYNNEGKVTQVTYPTTSSGTPTFSYSYDSMMRLTSMTDTSNYSQPVVNGAVYNAASQLTALNYYDATETRAYNSLMQLTNITTNDTYLPSSKINITYNYTAGSNNGKIGSATDAISGETVSYQYDSLNRLISASGSGWTQTQAYDGFGNLTGRTGTGTAQGTTISTPTNATTNRLSGYSYDANGNLISTGYAYDPENRISSVNAGALLYFYDAQNKRIWELPCQPSLCSTGNWAPQGQTINLFGPDGKQLASYSLGDTVVNNQVTVTFGAVAVRSYFGGRLVGQQLGANIYEPVIQDRLGSVGKYYPYGEERNSPQLPNDQVKFATYTRDSATGNDYADQRYYTSVLGRFMTPDPYQGRTGDSGDAGNPQSWNHYAYAGGDAVNRNDPHGQDWCDDDDLFCLVEDQGTYPGPVIGIDPAAIAAQIAAQVQASLQAEAAALPSQITALEQSGAIANYQQNANGSYDFTLSNGAFAAIGANDFLLSFTAAMAGTIAIGGATIDWSINALGQFILTGLNAFSAGVLALALEQPAGGKDEECLDQYNADIAVCRALGSASCYDQAMKRYAACITNKPIPPFPYQPPAPPRPRRPIHR